MSPGQALGLGFEAPRRTAWCQSQLGQAPASTLSKSVLLQEPGISAGLPAWLPTTASVSPSVKWPDRRGPVLTQGREEDQQGVTDGGQRVWGMGSDQTEEQLF